MNRNQLEQLHKLGKISFNGMSLEQVLLRQRADEILKERIIARQQQILSKFGRGISSF